jgi:hypothetical protein
MWQAQDVFRSSGRPTTFPAQLRSVEVRHRCPKFLKIPLPGSEPVLSGVYWHFMPWRGRIERDSGIVGAKDLAKDLWESTETGKT